MRTNGYSNGVRKLIIVSLLIIMLLIYMEIYVWNFAVTFKMMQPKIPWNASIEYTGNVTHGKAESIHVGTVICGDRLEEGITMLKSALIFSKAPIVFHIFIEDRLRLNISKEFESWPVWQRDRATIVLYAPYFPPVKPCPKCHTEDWSNLFAPCAAQRLFFPDILVNVDSLLYLDSDTLFLSPVEDVWAHISNFNSTQIFGIMVELSGWYADKTFPYCSDTGVNSGIILMNLTRMRPVRWFDQLLGYYATYKEKLQLWDQDMINIYCHFHPEQIYLLSCSWNYRGTFCPSERPCNETETLGTYILHGNSQVFHNDIFPAIRAVYRSVKEHNLTSQSVRDLYNSMLSNIKEFNDTDCGKRPHLFTRNVEKYILTHEETSGG